MAIQNRAIVQVRRLLVCAETFVRTIGMDGLSSRLKKNKKKGKGGE